MYKRNNPSARRSQNWISEALVSLMLQKKLNEITIKEIMNTTDLSRQTFYQVFDSVEDVLEYHMDTLFQEYIRRCKVENIDNLCVAVGLVGILDYWFKSGKTLSTDELADLVCRITSSE